MKLKPINETKEMNNILITTSTFADNNDELQKIIEKQDYNIIKNPYKRKLTESEIINLIKEYQPVGIVAGVEPLNRKVLNYAKNLKIISRCGIGMDSVDIKATTDFGIALKNTPDAPTIPVAELTLGLILSLLRKIHISNNSIRNSIWFRPMGNLLYGQTVGIVGYGRIGKYVSKLLHAFNCKLLAYDIVSPGTSNSDIIKMVPFDALLNQSDIVSLHLSFSDTNMNVINDEKLRLMKKNAVLINTARGELIDEDNLYWALTNSIIAGAALDCYKDEPYKGKLKELDNVILTAHIGSYAREGRMLMEKQSLMNLLTYLNETLL